jgi:hypothetical protein
VAFANATSITLPAHQAGDLLMIHAWADGTVTPPTAGGGFATLVSGGSSLNANRLGWLIASGSGTVSGTWTGATRLSCAVVRGATIDQSAGSLSGGGTKDLYWGPGAGSPFPGNRRALLFGENNAPYVGSDAAVAPTGYTNQGFVTAQGSVIHLSNGLVTVVDAFVSLTSTGGTPRYRTATVPLILS